MLYVITRLLLTYVIEILREYDSLQNCLCDNFRIMEHKLSLQHFNNWNCQAYIGSIYAETNSKRMNIFSGKVTKWLNPIEILIVTKLKAYYFKIVTRDDDNGIISWSHKIQEFVDVLDEIKLIRYEWIYKRKIMDK